MHTRTMRNMLHIKKLDDIKRGNRKWDHCQIEERQQIQCGNISASILNDWEVRRGLFLEVFVDTHRQTRQFFG